ncbi:MAG: acyl-CoA dehydrogenase family protein [Myxococcales bacterium]|nr:acyl-CoA dehydrogenase family protein [Myxococcales bacterium]
MADLEKFRSETRSWLNQNAPESIREIRFTELEGNWGGRKFEFAHPDLKVWLEVMVAKGWTAPAWPKELGGGDLSNAEARILAEEMKNLKLPPPLMGFGLEMIGRTILDTGTEEQKRQHIPPIVRGEIRWCQGYSEPDSGSDLASLQTRAVEDGDDYVVSGTKVWTSYADKSDWIFALTRTDPSAKKQDGITFLLIDMETPGVSVWPIQLISGKSPFCETRFDDVRVPRKNVLGQVNGGWSVAKALLGYERNMIAGAFGAAGGSSPKRPGSALANLARDYGLGEADGPLDDAAIRNDISQVEMDARAFALTTQRSKDAARAGHKPGPESSLVKLYATELNKRRADLSVRIAGPQGLGWEGAGFDAEEIDRTRSWLRTKGNSIEGGTSEIQLNVIAKRVLGLPDA